jgi:rhomboid family GlyGly-CTERM serine protease
MSDANRIHDPRHDLGVCGPQAHPRSATWLLGLIAATVVLLAFGGEGIRLLLRYERIAVLDAGEYWRLLTAHFVHGSMAHAALNLAGLAIIAALFPRHYSTRAWLAIGVASLMAIDVGFVRNEPELEWYVGLSGVLHGALAAGALAWWRLESKPLALALTAIVAGKLAWEQWAGALPLSGDLPVIVNAHLYGTIGGALAGAGVQAARHWPRIVRPL